MRTDCAAIGIRDGDNARPSRHAALALLRAWRPRRPFRRHAIHGAQTVFVAFARLTPRKRATRLAATPRLVAL